MANTPFDDLGTEEILSTRISGIQDAVKNIEQSLNMDTEAVANESLTLLADTMGRYRIAEAIGKRNWLNSPAPVIEQYIEGSWTQISTGFDIDYAGGAVIFADDKVGEQFRASFTRVKNTSGYQTHLAEKASQNKLGHVKVDEKTIFINEDGVISVSNPYPHDLSGSPGSKFLIAGTMEEGFFGEVPASELITGDALASECGISQGTSQHSTAGWLKFAYKGEILFVAKKPIRHSISWDAINTAKCVYGDSGDKTVTIDGLTYKVTLMRALEPSNDPKTVASGNSGAVNHHSEWNRLMCQIHEEAINGSWGYPNNIESDIGILEHSLGSGSQGMYSDADLVVASVDGRYSWCQETSTITSSRLARGHDGVSYSYYHTSSHTYSSLGWRPVLRLVEED